MRTRAFLLVSIIALVALTAGSGQAPTGQTPSQTSQAGSPAPLDEKWPREVTASGMTFKIHQPQVDSWDGIVLQAYTAFEIKTAGSDKPSYGAALFSARTQVDKVDRMVTLDDLKVVKVRLPSMPGNEARFQAALQEHVAPMTRLISLDRLEASLAITEATKKIESVPVKNDPPRIIVSTVPAMLVFVDGDPVWVAVKGVSAKRVLNTHPLILKDTTGRHFLHLFDGWVEATSLAGPWTVSTAPPSWLGQVLKDAVASGQVDLLTGEPDPEKGEQEKPSLSKKPLPVVTVATTPTELIVTDGAPKYVDIPGTALSYVENTTGNIFEHSGLGRTYVLISGRWFRAVSTRGPWEFVPYGDLPPDFAKIPDDNAKENVKACVPDTPEAMEAVIANHIPQTADVSRKSAQLNPPRFDGEPQFKPVEGTTLQYAVNTATPVIRVDAKTYYAVENGIWFKATSVDGPWQVADSVPTVIYTIPPSSPLHYVTYVKVYWSNAETVNVGYTPGYYGSCVTHGSGFVVVYGTGYHYTPWVGTVWFGPPVTYGFGCTMVYTPWTGWAFAYGFGWYWPVPMSPVFWGWGPYPWWGPVGWGHFYPYPFYRPPYAWHGGVAWGVRGAVAWGPGGWAATTGNVYHRYGNTSAVTRTSQGYNAYTGNRWASQVGMSYNSKTGTIAAGQRAAVGNVYTGNYAYGGRGVVTNTPSGKTVSGGKVTTGNARTGEQNSAAWIRGEDGGAVKKGDDIYAAKDGTVYRKGENGWESNSGGGWQSAGSDMPKTTNAPGAKPSTTGAARGGEYSGQTRPSPSQLDSQQRARSQGQARTQGFQSGGYRTAGGGGARRR